MARKGEGERTGLFVTGSFGSGEVGFEKKRGFWGGAGGEGGGKENILFHGGHGGGGAVGMRLEIGSK